MPHPLRSLFLDMDSFFASVEQHLQPRLRGKPVGVAPMLVESTCCIAASYEAKAFGIKTGTRVSDARRLCPGIEIVPARPPHYVEMHHRIIEIVESCIHVDHVLSIDEMVCWLPRNWRTLVKIEEVSQLIKARLREEFSESVRCSIGIAPNGWLAKIASKMRKPDGFFIIQAADLPNVLYELALLDLHGVGHNMEARLHANGIHTVEQLCNTQKEILARIWGGIEGKRIWHKLRGEVLDDYDTEPTKRSLSHGHVLPPELRDPAHAIAVVHRLTQKAALRTRAHGLRVGALDLELRFINREKWSQSTSFAETSDALFLTKEIKSLWKSRPYQDLAIQKANVILHKLVSEGGFTPSLFEQNKTNRDALNKAMDAVTHKFGKQALYLGGAHEAMDTAQPKIAFNHIPDVRLEG